MNATTTATALMALVSTTWIAGCFLAKSTSGGDAGADGASGSPGTPGAGATGDAGLSNCATDPLTRVRLCTAVASCPSLVINHDVFPNCGYRAVGGSFDIQCWCDGYVCPLGSPTSCADVEQLMTNQSEQLVCLQVNEGRCTQPQKAGATTGGPSSACQTCMQQCGYTPGCKDSCGC